MLTEYIDGVIIMRAIIGLILIGWLWLGIRRLKRKKKADSVILLVLFVCWNIWCISERLQPRPVYTDSLPELVNRVEVSHYHIWHITRGDKNYFQVIGPNSVIAIMKQIVTVRSGPPGYTFNQQGALVDWVRDIGEAPRSWDQWDIMSQRMERITFDQALAVIEKTTQEFVEHSAPSGMTSPQEKGPQE